MAQVLLLSRCSNDCSNWCASATPQKYNRNDGFPFRKVLESAVHELVVVREENHGLQCEEKHHGQWQ